MAAVSITQLFTPTEIDAHALEALRLFQSSRKLVWLRAAWALAQLAEEMDQ